MTMTAEAQAGDSSPEETAVPGEVPALTGGEGPVAVRVFPGLAEQTAEARRWVRALAAHHGGLDPDAVELIADELFANAVLHTRSGQVGGKVTVAVTADGVVHVHDYGTTGPCPGLAGGPAANGDRREESGRGLKLVAALSGGLAHLPAAWCPVSGPDDPAAGAGGCCTCCRPGPPSLSSGPRNRNQGSPPWLPCRKETTADDDHRHIPGAGANEGQQ
jgi:serine/threonine-protein kinase RsbW